MKKKKIEKQRTDQFFEQVDGLYIWLSNFNLKSFDPQLLNSKGHHYQNRLLSKSFATAILTKKQSDQKWDQGDLILCSQRLNQPKT